MNEAATVVLIVLITELWFFSPPIITSFLAIAMALFTIIASFVTWRIDRNRLKTLEIDRDKMKTEIKENRGKTVASLSELRAELKGYNSEVLDKIDELKMYLLNSKISLKGESERENGKDNNHFY